ncbi:MAG: hypothetical protein KatS3mg111_2397 [Pirellulaceae bacterium]|nr:MAG: hypothetical protein KatS3mg111_2397 [Pirellulaceae bacterium]
MRVMAISMEVMNPVANNNQSSCPPTRRIRHVISLVLAVIALAAVSPPVHGQEWMTWTSTYTHDLETGQRIDQFAEPQQPLGPDEFAARRSGYRHYRSTLQAGLSTDNYHVVEKWGEEVIPYEHWRFPFRPYGAPYPAWGPPTPYGMFWGGFPYPVPYHHPHNRPAESNAGASATGSAAAGGTSGGSAGPAGSPYTWPYGTGYGYPPYYPGFPLQPHYRGQPWFDGTYPAAPPLDRRTDAEFFYHPPLGRPASP